MSFSQISALFILIRPTTDNGSLATLNIAEIVISSAEERLTVLHVEYSSGLGEPFEIQKAFDTDVLSFYSSVETNNATLTIDTMNKTFDRLKIYNRLGDCCLSSIQAFSLFIYQDSSEGTLAQPPLYAYDFNSTKPSAVYDFALIWNEDLMAITSSTVNAHSYKSTSQVRQDLWVITYFNQRRNGKYLDIGANDGFTFSNSFMLEKEFGWSGVLVEPQSKLMPSLYTHRGNTNNHILNACVYNRTYLASFIDISSTTEHTVNHGFGEDMLSGVVDSWAWKSKGWIVEDSPTIQVPCYNGQSVLDAHNITHVHYLSVDAEGADEIILRSFDWTRFSADVISLEYVNAETYYSVERLFYDLGYAHVELSGHDALFFREWRHYPGVLDVARARQQQEGTVDYQTPMRMTPAAAAAEQQEVQEQP